MTSIAARAEPVEPAALNDDSTFDRVLAVFESAPDDRPFESADVLLLTRLQSAAREREARILDALLLEGRGDAILALAVVHDAQAQHRRIADALAEAALRLVNRPQLPEEQLHCARLALRSLQARADEIKWHAFEQTSVAPSSWQRTHRLVRAIESLGLERHSIDGEASCSDAFAQGLLLATLNVGILTPPQMELAQRWLTTQARSLPVEPFCDPEVHCYQVDLAGANGPERVSSAAIAAETTRFLAAAPLGAALAHARSQLYAGKLSVGATPSRVVALHFGAFLDLAEKLWSQDFRRATWRAERENAAGESIEVVLGFDAVMALLDFDDDDPGRPAAESWALRDRSATGLGATLPPEAGERIALGTLIAFRHPGDAGWRLGAIVRRIRVADPGQWIIGVRRLSETPLLVDLEASSERLTLETEAGPAPVGIYAPIEADGGRIDGLVIEAERFSANEELLLPTARSRFRIRANRVIDRGDRWLRVGFEVLGKR